MNRLKLKAKNSKLRASRVRAKISGTSQKPRISVRISNQHISAQIIDDTVSKTLASVTTVGSQATGTMSEKAKWVGEQLAKKAKTAKIKTVVFDRGDRLYHGRIKALADSARENGLEF